MGTWSVLICAYFDKVDILFTIFGKKRQIRTILKAVIESQRSNPATQLHKSVLYFAQGAHVTTML